ncbi:hypothetical protein MMC07_006364 [Pseudocyphellaria aurata]|nr:hypothetical protein [Pseudocyphellaria aurata]
MFALFGLAGQSIYNRADGAHTQSVLAAAAPVAQKQITPPSSWTKRYSPVRVLSDEEYESMLRERLLAVEAEIALLDEKIEGLRALEGEREDGKEKKEDDIDTGSGRK